MNGRIGFLGVQAQVTSFSLSKVDGGQPVLGVNFLPKNIAYDLEGASTTLTGVIGVRDLIDRPNLNLPGEAGYTASSLNLAMASSLLVSADLSGSTLSGGVNINWPDVSTGTPAVTLVDPYPTDLLPFDIHPTVVGIAGEGSAGNAR